MTNKPAKTNAVRLLERHGIAHDLVTYAVDPEDLLAEHVAQKIGLPAQAVFKTLVARGDKTGALFAVVAADSILDLKRLAQVSGNKRVELVPLKEVEPLTGYIRGGVTALGAKKSFPVFVDERMSQVQKVSVSAGRRGLQMLLAPADYIRVTGAVTGDICRLETPEEMEPGSESL